MFIGSALLWSKINREYFEIARSYDEVICIGCVVVFTLAISVLLVLDVILIFNIPNVANLQISRAPLELLLLSVLHCFIHYRNYSHHLEASFGCKKYEHC